MDYYSARRRDKRAAAAVIVPALAVVAIVPPDPPAEDRGGIPAPRDPQPAHSPADVDDVLIALALADPVSVLASDLRAAAEAAGATRRKRLHRLADAIVDASPIYRAG